MSRRALSLLFPLAGLGAAFWLASAADPAVSGLIRQANGEILLTATADAGAFYRIETSPDLATWTPFVTVRSTGTEQVLDVATPRLDRRFYRAVPLEGISHITGDHLPTSAGDAILRPITHAAVLVSWNGKILYSDPGGTASFFTGLPQADVIVVTHTHGDHFSSTRLNALVKSSTVIFAPQAVFDGMSAALRALTSVLANGATGSAHGVTVRAIPMYNLPGERENNHPFGRGNGYVVTLGGADVYFSGDTEDIPEMRALTGIEAAFVCMSLPSNMTVEAAASAVRDFRPRLVFPYHFQQGSSLFDTARFKTLVGTDLDIEVRQRRFY